MDKLIAKLNIEPYRKLLASADFDESERRTVEIPRHRARDAGADQNRSSGREGPVKAELTLCR